MVAERVAGAAPGVERGAAIRVAGQHVGIHEAEGLDDAVGAEGIHVRIDDAQPRYAGRERAVGRQVVHGDGHVSVRAGAASGTGGLAGLPR